MQPCSSLLKLLPGECKTKNNRVSDYRSRQKTDTQRIGCVRAANCCPHFLNSSGLSGANYCKITAEPKSSGQTVASKRTVSYRMSVKILLLCRPLKGLKVNCIRPGIRDQIRQPCHKSPIHHQSIFFRLCAGHRPYLHSAIMFLLRFATKFPPGTAAAGLPGQRKALT